MTELKHWVKQILTSRYLGTKRNIRENKSAQCFAPECINVSAMYQQCISNSPYIYGLFTNYKTLKHSLLLELDIGIIGI